MQIKFSKKFGKNYDKAPEKIKKSFDERLKLFQQGKFNRLLNNHLLIGRYKGYRSINITGDWRAIFREIGDTVYFEILGTHSELYG